MPEQKRLESTSIADLFKSREAHPDEMADALKEKDFEEIAKKTSQWRKPIPWSAMQQKISEVIAATINSPVMDAWVSAWQKYDAIVDKAEESAKSPQEPVRCSVVEHTVDSTISPKIDVYLNRVHIGDIKCSVGLSTHFEGLTLELMGGSIVALTTGTCSWSGSIAANGVTLIERDFGEWDLKERVEFKPPIRLAAPQ